MMDNIDEVTAQCDPLTAPRINTLMAHIPVSQLDDLDFADDLALALLFHTQPQMQAKTDIVAQHSARLV